ncbi:ethanolamine ammonia-lyase light chain [Alteromonadaceae bacterium 2753L.S.0a.02]|nr:ethanolamine ammonia-lyase light chain [Alteromonadaceae bacterium 2753L.S.0a.02]
MNKPTVIANPWQRLRHFTAARVGLGRAGSSIPTKELLAFQLDHARAQDAVHLPLNIEKISAELAELHDVTPPLVLQSQARDRFEYLQRPDLGRRLNENSRQLLQTANQNPQTRYDLSIVVADGLSSQAIQENIAAFVSHLLAVLKSDQHPWQVAPLTLVTQGRVAIADEIGELLNSDAVLMCIGERPGLSSPDSLGLYLTWQPHPGRNDAERNCISNVRPLGLSYSEAVTRLMYLLKESRRLQLSGVNLKDRTKSDVVELQSGAKNFLLPGQ